MRGKRCSSAYCACSSGITPADAGKTALYKKGDIVIEDHPRGCGENLTLLQRRRTDTGSPPRMRGKRSGGAPHYIKPGITPADAGKTLHMLRCVLG